MRALILSVIASLVLPVCVEAQTCLGNVPVDRNHRGFVNVPIEFSSGVSRVGGEVGGGSDGGFIAGGVLFTNYGDLTVDARSWGLSVNGGSQIAANPDRRFMICPMTFINYERVLSDDFLEDESAWGYTTRIGVSVGVVAYQTPTVRVVPTGGFYYVRDFARFNLGPDSFDVRENLGELRAGVGIHFNRSAITPMVVVPFASDVVNETSFRLVYSASFGVR